MNIDRYKNDLAKLIRAGKLLLLSMVFEQKIDIKADMDKEAQKKLPRFTDQYDSWYLESLACVRQLLPDRVDDFVSLYKPPKTRKDLNYGNYTISDYLRGLTATRGWNKEKVVGPDAAIPAMQQQLNIVEALSVRFESSLFDILTLVQADLFDGELETRKVFIEPRVQWLA
jgi:hypothetical protein